MSAKKQIAVLDDLEQKPKSQGKAKIYDEWVASLPEQERIQANLMLENVLGLPNIGELLAKELLVSALGFYAERRPK